jgi:cysteine desulfurase
MQRAIYLDCNASHPLLTSVRQALAQAILEGSGELGNPSSVHRYGQKAKRVMAEARQELGRFLGRADGDEIIFLSGATEAMNLAFRGFVEDRSLTGRPARLVTTAVEHSSVLDTVRALDPEARILPVDSHGQLDPSELGAALEEAVSAGFDVLLCLQAANNETGVAYDLERLLKETYFRFGPGASTAAPVKGAKRFSEAPEQKVWILVDAAQALCKIDDSELRRVLYYADYAALSAHKMGGPTGIGALWTRPKVPFRPQISGGTQERRRRAGTPNSLGLYGWLVALRDWSKNGDAYRRNMSELRKLAFEGLSRMPGLVVHGRGADGSLPKLPNTLNFHFEGCPEESLLLALDLDGFSLSSGSACNSGSRRPSHVLRALGFRDEESLSAVRMCVGAESKREDVEAFVDAALAKVQHIRASREKARTLLPEL